MQILVIAFSAVVLAALAATLGSTLNSIAKAPQEETAAVESSSSGAGMPAETGDGATAEDAMSDGGAMQGEPEGEDARAGSAEAASGGETDPNVDPVRGDPDTGTEAAGAEEVGGEEDRPRTGSPEAEQEQQQAEDAGQDPPQKQN